MISDPHPPPQGKSRPYHHGALREALLAAGERILDRDGINGLTLRAVAREAGASHAAPKNHFPDLAALSSALAAVGFDRFADRLAAAADGAASPAERPAEVGKAYVRFAVDHPGLFLLMFRSERLDGSDPALAAAMDRSTALLAGVVARLLYSPGGALASIPLAGRLGAMALGLAVFWATRRSVFAAVIVAEAALIATGYFTR